jgi:hypothetical protein
VELQCNLRVGHNGRSCPHCTAVMLKYTLQY